MTSFVGFRGSPPERFFRKVQFSAEENGCWIWGASLQTNGYGHFYDGGDVLAHRWLYAFCVGPIRAGLTLDHLCRERRCVNPDHLEPVSLRTNVLRGNAPAAINARKTHCLRGHPLSGSNLGAKRRNSPGARGDCLACKRWRRRRGREKVRSHA